MTLKDYLRHFIWGAVLFGIIVYTLWDKSRTETIEGLYLLAACCMLMFPFAKQCIEQIALRYTRTEDWTTGIWMETPAKTAFMQCTTCFSLPSRSPWEPAM
jgi:hypothetical protein